MAEEGRTERRLAVWGGLFGGRLNELANPLRGGSSSRLRSGCCFARKGAVARARGG